MPFPLQHLPVKRERSDWSKISFEQIQAMMAIQKAWEKNLTLSLPEPAQDMAAIAA